MRRAQASAPTLVSTLVLALRSEVRKVLSTRMWWLLAIVLLGYLGFLGAVMGFSLTTDPEAMTGGLGDGTQLDGRTIAETVYTLAVSLGYVFPLVIGALSMTAEYRHRTITPVVLAEPRRGVVLGAKLVVGALLGAVYGVVGTAGAVLGGLPFLLAKSDGTHLGEGDVLADLAFSVLALAIWCVIGVGLGTLLTNQIASVIVILAFTQFVEPVLRLGLASVDALAGAQKLLPGAAAEALAGSSLYSSTGMLGLLDRGWGAVVLLGYAALFALLGRYTTLRRDIS
jgi:ABC-type transport system involved in multi-copper enzyme maturation permease subunit